MTEGDAGVDLREVDVNRFHPHQVSPAYVKARAQRQYVEVYDIIHPRQQMESPRSLRTSPYHCRLRDLGAVFFEAAGWERAEWFGVNESLRNGDEGPGRSGWTARYWSPIIGAEHQAARARVGMFDLTPFTKIDVSGPAALDYLQSIASNQVDRPIGRITYTSMLTARGGIKCDLTITRLGPERFQVVTGAGTGPLDLSWMRRQVPAGAAVNISDLTSARCCIGLWGPRARDVLQLLCEQDLSNRAFPYLTAQQIHVGSIPALALRISYVGELGWEVYTPTEYGLQLWDSLWEVGQPFGVTAVGSGAFDSLRLEKGYRLWGSELHTEYHPFEAGLGFAVRMGKGEFLGRAALEAIVARGPKLKLCCLTLDDPAVVVMSKEPILAGEQGERVLGYVTSANYGYTVGRSIAYGYLPIESANEGTRVWVYFFGERHSARVSGEPLYDPENARLRDL